MPDFREIGGKLLPPEEVDLETQALRCGSVGDLARLWRRAKPGFTRELTGKQLGQLRKLAEAVGGFQAAASVLLWACRNWNVLMMATTRGRSGPTSPHVGYLLACTDEAVTLSTKVASTTCQTSDQEVADPGRAREPEMTEEERREYEALLDDLS